MSVLPHASRKEVDLPSIPDPHFRPLGDFARECRLGNVLLPGRVFLAPMAGYTDRPFRRLARRFGAALVATEMVSARALLADKGKTLKLMDFGEEERPVSVQLFGGEPQIVGEAAAFVVKNVRPDLLDLNFGCPVAKILKSGSGSALLSDPRRAGDIVRCVVDAVAGKVPVTVKTRGGIESFDGAALEILKASEEAGAAAFALHARTRRQMYGGRADWDWIAQVKRVARIPVIGNGDVRNPQDAGRMMRETGCDAVMVGRACVGAPWIFRRMNVYLETGMELPPETLRFRLATALEHFQDAVLQKGPRTGVLEMKPHLTHYVKGFDGARELRQTLLLSNDVKKVIRTLEEALALFQEGEPDA